MRKIRLTGSLALKDQAAHENDIDALLTEYSALKAEETICEQSQMQITTAVFSFIGVVLGLNFLFQRDVGTVSQSSQYIILGFCPILIMFFGCLCMYQLYCQMRFGAYLYHLENDINKCCSENKNKIYFEHWIINQEKGKKFMARASWLYGCITLGTWLFSPFLLVFFAAGFFPDWDVWGFYWQNKPLTVILVAIFIIYCIVQGVYVTTILSLKNEKNLNKDRV